MKRFALQYLNKWAADRPRKPLIIRGARQVGKSTLVRQFAESAGRNAAVGTLLSGTASALVADKWFTPNSAANTIHNTRAAQGLAPGQGGGLGL